VSKREKKVGKAPATESRGGVPNAAPAKRPRHAPKKQPFMLAISILLFALWFVFLLVTAVFG